MRQSRALIGNESTPLLGMSVLTKVIIACVVTAGVFAVALGVPLGILSSKSTPPPPGPVNSLRIVEDQLLELSWPMVIRAGVSNIINIQVANVNDMLNITGIVVANSLGSVYCSSSAFVDNTIAVLEPGEVIGCYAIYVLTFGNVASDKVVSTSNALGTQGLLAVSASDSTTLVLSRAIEDRHTIVVSDFFSHQNTFYSGPCNGTTPIGGPPCPGLFDSSVNSTWLCNNTNQLVKCESDGNWTQVYSVQGTTGATGAQGAAGAPGASGATGAQGATGATGTSGGGIGVTGATGGVGPSGAQGVSGTTGATGAAGSSGSTGATGASGTQGTSGATGATGAVGSGGSSFVSTADCGDNVTSVVTLGTSPVQTCNAGKTNASLYCRDNGHLFECNGTLWIYQSVIGPVYSNTCNASLNNTDIIGGKTCHFNTSILVCINLDYTYICGGTNWTLLTDIPDDFIYASRVSGSDVWLTSPYQIPFNYVLLSGGGITVSGSNDSFTILHSGLYIASTSVKAVSGFGPEYVDIHIVVNSTIIAQGTAVNGSDTVSVTIVKPLYTGDIVSAQLSSPTSAVFSNLTSFISIARIVT